MSNDRRKIKDGWDPVLDVWEAAEFLKISETEMLQLIAERRVPFFRIQGRCMFYRPILEQWIVRNLVRPQNSLNGDTAVRFEPSVQELSGKSEGGGVLDGYNRVTDYEGIPTRTLSVTTVSGDPRSEEPTVGSPLAPGAGQVFDHFSTKYLDYVTTNFSSNTLANAKRVLKEFSRIFGTRQLATFTLQDIEVYKKIRKDAGVSDSTINIDIRTLRAVFNIAVDWMLIVQNPFAKARLIKIPDRGKAHLTQEEFKMVLDAVGEGWLHDVLAFAVLTGLRRGEIMNLRWEAYDKEKRSLTVESTDGYQVKGGKRRVIPLNDEACEILERRRRDSEWIFADKGGRRYSDDYVSRLFKNAVRAAGLSEELHFHSLRHTYCTWAAGNGVPIHVLKQLAGHSTIQVTEQYLGTDEESLRRGAEKVTLPQNSSGDGDVNLEGENECCDLEQ